MSFKLLLYLKTSQTSFRSESEDTLGDIFLQGLQRRGGGLPHMSHGVSPFLPVFFFWGGV